MQSNETLYICHLSPRLSEYGLTGTKRLLASMALKSVASGCIRSSDDHDLDGYRLWLWHRRFRCKRPCHVVSLNMVCKISNVPYRYSDIPRWSTRFGMG